MTRSRDRWLALPCAFALCVLAACAEMPFNFGPPGATGPKPPPGALNEAVTQANIKRTICRAQWVQAARPGAAFVAEMKSRLMKDTGVPGADASKWVLDFLVPISLGGHPGKLENLWLQPSEGAWSARTKDRLETRLRSLVCSGEVRLHEAREAMRTDWKMAARYYLSDRELLEPLE
jgi:hypothetical protein